MRQPAARQAFQRVLSEDLRPPAYLTNEELQGGWCDLFPDLALSLPAPYPIFGADEEKIITYGYPILVSEGMWTLRREVEKLVVLEVKHRLGGPATEVDATNKDQVAAQRDRYLRATTTIIENVLMNDYGRGLSEVFLLFHSGDVVRSLGQVAKHVQLNFPDAGRNATEETRQFITGVFGMGYFHRAADARHKDGGRLLGDRGQGQHRGQQDAQDAQPGGMFP